jgi:glycosyltransferase involved in cell wall biosynthesis
MPLVSIIIPCHNSAPWLARAIDSALAQTVADKEIIIADDDSTDDTPAIIASYGSKIRAIRGTWHNGSAARNAGLAISQGQWIQFLDADDELLPDKIEAQIKALRPNTDVTYGPVIERIHRGDTIHDIFHTPDPDCDTIELWLRWQLFQTSTGLWNAQAIKKIGAWNETYSCCQDNELTLRAIQHNLQFQYVPSSVTIYRVWSKSTVTGKNPHHYLIRTQLIEQCLQWLKEKGQLTPRHIRAAGQSCFEVSRRLYTTYPAAAIQYHQECRNKNLIFPAGIAAPLLYRIAYHCLGFHNAEKIASLIRYIKARSRLSH